MQDILVGRFPILLIDESQDTNKDLIEAFLKAQKNKSNCFTLGMFGDTMQRIYFDGKKDLSKNIPEGWLKPKKKINYRCPKRVVDLINKVRYKVDEEEQANYKDYDGMVRLFIIKNTNDIDKTHVESLIKSYMAKATNDSRWNELNDDVKILTLEHHLAEDSLTIVAYTQDPLEIHKFVSREGWFKDEEIIDENKLYNRI